MIKGGGLKGPPLFFASTSSPRKRGSRFLPTSQDITEPVEPVRVLLLDQTDLPLAAPLLHRFFPCDSVLDPLVVFGVDEAVGAIPIYEIGAVAIAMLVNAGGQIRRHADLNRPAIAVGHEVDPAALHSIKRDLRLRGGDEGKGERRNY